MEIKGALRRSILWVLLLSTQIFCSDMISQNCSVIKNKNSSLGIETTNLKDSTDIWYYVERPKHYRNVERTSTFKTDSVLVTASLPYKVCKDSTLTISLKLKNLSRQPIYCVPDMEELISFGKELNTGMGFAKIDYMLPSYNKDKELVKMIMIDPDSIFTSEVTINLHDIKLFDFEELKRRYVYRYFLRVGLNFAYVPSSSIIKKENIKHEAGGNYILMNLNDASYPAVVLDFGFFKCWIEKCR